MKRIERLKAARAEIDEMTPYQFSIRVSDILRRYVTEQYQLPVTRQTSVEFLNALARSGNFPKTRNLAHRFLESMRLDQVRALRSDDRGQPVAARRSNAFRERRPACTCLIGCRAVPAFPSARPGFVCSCSRCPCSLICADDAEPAAALVFSSTYVLRGIGKATRRAPGKILRSPFFVSLAIFIVWRWPGRAWAKV